MREVRQLSGEVACPNAMNFAIVSRRIGSRYLARSLCSACRLHTTSQSKGNDATTTSTKLSPAVELNKRLIGAQSGAEALDLFVSHRDLMDPVNLGTCLHRVCKLERASASTPIARTRDFERLVDAVRAALPRMSEHTLGSVIWSLAKTGRLCDDVADDVISVAMPTLERLRPQTLGLLGWGLARSTTSRIDWLTEIRRVFIERLPRLDDVQTISTIAHSFAKRGLLTSGAFRAIEVRSLELIDQFPTRSLELLLHAMATSKNRSPTLLSSIAKVGMNRLENMDGSSLATFASAYAKLDFYDPTLMNALIQKVINQIEFMTPYAVTNFVWSLATLRLYDDDLMESAVRHARDNLRVYALHDVGNLAWGMAALNCLSSSSSSSRYVVDLLCRLVERVEAQLDDIRPFVLLNFLWSCLVFDVYPKRLYEHVFADRFLAKTSLTVEMVHQFCQLYVGARYERPELGLASVSSSHLQRILGDAKENMRSNVNPSDFQNRVVAVLNGILGGTEFLKREVTLDYGYSIDAQVLLNGDVPVSVSDELGLLINRLRSDNTSRSDIRRLAIEMDGPWHFLRDTEKRVGATVLKQRQLKALGWEVVNVRGYI